MQTSAKSIVSNNHGNDFLGPTAMEKDELVQNAASLGNHSCFVIVPAVCPGRLATCVAWTVSLKLKMFCRRKVYQTFTEKKKHRWFWRYRTSFGGWLKQMLWTEHKPTEKRKVDFVDADSASIWRIQFWWQLEQKQKQNCRWNHPQGHHEITDGFVPCDMGWMGLLEGHDQQKERSLIYVHALRPATASTNTAQAKQKLLLILKEKV